MFIETFHLCFSTRILWSLSYRIKSLDWKYFLVLYLSGDFVYSKPSKMKKFRIEFQTFVKKHSNLHLQCAVFTTFSFILLHSFISTCHRAQIFTELKHSFIHTESLSSSLCGWSISETSKKTVLCTIYSWMRCSNARFDGTCSNSIDRLNQKFVLTVCTLWPQCVV